MRSDAIKPGDVIAGKYRVRAILSRQRGFLVEAFHTEFDQRVVIRILSPQLVDEKEVERFRREARTLAKLESEHVARIVDVGKTKDGAFYFARQYLEGQDLASHLKQRGALPVADAVLYILQAAEAVAETHVHNIILRELQPAHLFLTQRIGGQQVKIIDFGTAKLMRDAAAPSAGGELTATAMFGLSSYSSPELVRKAQHVDVRTDVWSLGAILYQLLTARPPFEGEMAALMLAITRDDPVPVTRFRRDVAPEIDNIISWSLAKDPDGRFANVHAFAHALLPFTTAEGQILVKRIGDITTAGKQRRQPAAAPGATDRDHPITMDNGDLLDDDEDNPRTAYRAPDAPAVSPNYRANVDDDDDDPRTAYRPPDAPAVSPNYRSNAVPPGPPKPAAPAPPAPPAAAEGSPLERTMYIAAEQPAPPPPAGRGPAFAGAAADPQQASHPGRPAWQPMPVPLPPGGAAGQPPAGYPAPPMTAPGMAPPPVEVAAPRPHVPPSALATIQSSSPSVGFPGAKPPPKAQKMALAAVAGAVVLLSVVAVLVVFKGRSSSTAETTAASASAVPSAQPVTMAARTADTAATAAPTAPAATTAAAADPPPPADPGPVATATPVATGGKTVPGKLTAKTADPPGKGKPDPTPPAGGGGDNGTLVAVAVGGSCAFSVNGASKGTTSTLKLSVKPGTYSVTCAPSSGSSKSKSVTVTSGGTAMAMFKL